MSREKCHFALPHTVKLIGWLPVAGSSLATVMLLILGASSKPAAGAELAPLVRVAEVIVPLAVALQAAFLLSPEDEQPLELLLACPRPLSRTLLKRLLVMAARQGGVAFIATLAGQAIGTGEGLALASARWIAPAAFTGGTVLYTTMITRKGTFGALMGTILWGGMLMGGSALLERWPWMWPLHVYLQPGEVPPARYAANRIGLTLAGAALTLLSAWLTRDEEHMLGVAKTRRHNCSAYGEKW